MAKKRKQTKKKVNAKTKSGFKKDRSIILKEIIIVLLIIAVLVLIIRCSSNTVEERVGAVEEVGREDAETPVSVEEEEEEEKDQVVEGVQDEEGKPPELQQPMNDFPSKDAGTFLAQVRNTYIKEPIDEIVVLIHSANVPGVSLVYNSKENKLIGGTPQITAENVVLFDGNPHRVGYTFERNGKQAIIYDNQIVAESDFQSYSDLITGQATGGDIFFVSDAVENGDIS